MATVTAMVTTLHGQTTVDGLSSLSSLCLNARRRRRAGLNPYRGTGWLAGQTPPGHAPAQYAGPPQPYYNNTPQQGYDQNPPVYAPPQTQNYGAEHHGYFGGQQTGIELQQPNNSYQPQRGVEPVYGAPDGPPPAKRNGDGIIR
ncbi:hypothetical protein MMC14_008948 [Varicellaria rhodocarpa]|nr:hypothetical protein [Varicellaria rhodocarpa]